MNSNRAFRCQVEIITYLLSSSILLCIISFLHLEMRRRDEFGGGRDLEMESSKSIPHWVLTEEVCVLDKICLGIKYSAVGHEFSVNVSTTYIKYKTMLCIEGCKNVIRGLQELNSLYLLVAIVQYLLIQHLQWLYRTSLPWIMKINYTHIYVYSVYPHPFQVIKHQCLWSSLYATSRWHCPESFLSPKLITILNFMSSLYYFSFLLYVTCK